MQYCGVFVCDKLMLFYLNYLIELENVFIILFVQQIIEQDPTLEHCKLNSKLIER